MSGVDFRAVHAVIFDMDGVIFDSERLYVDCCSEAAEGLGMEGIVETTLRCIGVRADVTDQILLDAYGDRALIDRFQEAAKALFLEKYRAGLLAVKPGVRELLAYLKRRGAGLAVASSTRTDIVEKELADAGLLPFFDRVVGGDQVSRSKPHPDIFLRAAEALGEQAEHSRDRGFLQRGPCRPGGGHAGDHGAGPAAAGRGDALARRRGGTLPAPCTGKNAERRS